MISGYLYFLLIIIFLCQNHEPKTASAVSVAKPGCKDSCGNNVTIPFPFGIGNKECFFNEWFEVRCLFEVPYLNKIGAEILNVSELNNKFITVNSNMPEMHVCQEKSNFLLLPGSLTAESPIRYSTGNKFMVVGCGHAVLFEGQKTVAGCTSMCDDPLGKSQNGCYGLNYCCETRLTDSVENYYVNFSNKLTGREFCGSVFFVEETWYPENFTMFSKSSNPLVGIPVPTILVWDIPIDQYIKLGFGDDGCPGYYEYTTNPPGRDVTKFSCQCHTCDEGNPYFPGGCKEINTEACPLQPPKKSNGTVSTQVLIVLIVIGTSLGILVTASCTLGVKRTKKRNEIKFKEKCFKRNGGLLLHQQLCANNNVTGKVKLFESKELENATDNFNEDRILGRGGQGTVYKGMLTDGRIVAIKKSKFVNQNQLEQFVNEIVILADITHRNVVKLIGCCLETEVPLLVYEFIPNGTLYNLLQNEIDEFHLDWEIRLKIGIEIAGALTYLHSASSIPIYHRDIKSSNILLDEKYRAKLSDFGISRHIAVDQTHLTTLVKGTFGYLDPEYFRSCQFTEKSDVYSFGIVLVELLTGQKPVSSCHNPDEEYSLSLATRFLTAMEENSLNLLLDAHVLETAREIEVSSVAKLAQRCLCLDGRKRPTMSEVLIELESLKMSK